MVLKPGGRLQAFTVSMRNAVSLSALRCFNADHDEDPDTYLP